MFKAVEMWSGYDGFQPHIQKKICFICLIRQELWKNLILIPNIVTFPNSLATVTISDLIDCE